MGFPLENSVDILIPKISLTLSAFLKDHPDKTQSDYDTYKKAYEDARTYYRSYFDQQFEAAVRRSVLTSKVMQLIRDSAIITEN